jgi:hypothetical protein
MKGRRIGRRFEIPAYAGERLVQLGRKEQKTVQPGSKKDRTVSKKNGEADSERKDTAYQQLCTRFLTNPYRPRRMVRCPYLARRGGNR